MPTGDLVFVSSDRTPRIGFVGIGEVGAGYARVVLNGGLPPQCVRILYLSDRAGADPRRAAVTAAELGVALFTTPADFVAGLDLVVSTVTPNSALSAARVLAGHLPPECSYLDLNSVSPRTKRAIAELFSGGAAQVIDGAIMGAPAASGVMSISLSGERAPRVSEILTPLGARVTIVGDRVGMAATIKMTRSVVMKGLAMLLMESLWAARQARVEDAVLAGLEDALHHRDFGTLVQRLVCGSLHHAGRRIGEMEEVEAFLGELGVPAEMTRATRDRLVYLASRADEWRYADVSEVAAALDAVAAVPGGEKQC
jgi:3-hydroxyisobutyrate dehydrogenase-like beta-hydroxyacid dehydrogenase